jgi:hypothetical protein
LRKSQPKQHNTQRLLKLFDLHVRTSHRSVSDRSERCVQQGNDEYRIKSVTGSGSAYLEAFPVLECIVGNCIEPRSELPSCPSQGRQQD